MKKTSLILIFTVIFQSFVLKAFSNAGLKYFQKLKPTDYEISLLTVERGPQFYALGGHSLFRLKENNKEIPYDIAVNWGVFDFRAPNFFENAVFGKLNYRSIVQSMGSVYWLYSREKRDILENKLFLTSRQKQKLLERLIWWTLPENSTYRYDLFFKNCSTILRDELATNLGPDFKSYFIKQSSPTFRELHHKYFYPYPFSILAPIFITSVSDKPLTAWERFIMPVELPYLLKDIGRFDDSGVMQEAKLLGPTVKIFSGGFYPLPDNDHYSLMVLASLLSLTFFAFIGLKWGTNSIRFRLLGFNLLALGMLSFTFSCAMIFTWAFTEYSFLFHNALLWFFWPTDIIYAVLGFKLLVFNRTPQMHSQIKKLGTFFMKGHFVALIIQTSLWVTGLIQQDLIVFYLYLLLPYGMTAFLCQKYIFKT